MWFKAFLFYCLYSRGHLFMLFKYTLGKLLGQVASESGHLFKPRKALVQCAVLFATRCIYNKESVALPVPLGSQ